MYLRAAYENQPAMRQQSAPPLIPDYYVTPKKLHPYDLKSAHALTQQRVWVKKAIAIPTIAMTGVAAALDFEHDAGLLLPIERLEIKDVVTDTAPNSGGQKQVMALFEKDAKTYAFQVGLIKDGEYKNLFGRDALH